MNSIVYVGMDVHKEQYTLCCYSYDTDKVEYKQTIPSDYKLVLKYMEQIRSRYEGEVSFVCGYEAGCLGYSLYHQLKDHAVDCKILAPSTMAITNTHHVKTDKRDAANIARCLAFHTYSEVYVPNNDDNDVIVTAVNVSVGDVNTANATLVTVENNTDMIVNASVTEKDILKLQEGMKAIITSDALDDQKINGEIIKVVKVYNASQPTTEQTGKETSGAANTGGFSVQIKLEPCNLISGMSAKAKIVLTDRENVLSVPYDLVQQDEDGKNYVLCAEENKDGTYTAVKKNITVGDEINYYTEVTGGDLKAGDYIIMDYSISEGDTFQGERGSDVSETEDGDSTGMSSEVTAD